MCWLRSKRFPTDLPVARAELVGLQTVEDAQHFFGIAADVQVIDRYVLNHIVGIDDERCA